mmetsp:Transcript_43120/g.137142  ORF Transcript_43120/g.137142 Transcript_43120/m.137142 type:complete len:212 (-) Transcript_43120:119-754(-)
MEKTTAAAGPAGRPAPGQAPLQLTSPAPRSSRSNASSRSSAAPGLSRAAEKATWRCRPSAAQPETSKANLQCGSWLCASAGAAAPGAPSPPKGQKLRRKQTPGHSVSWKGLQMLCLESGSVQGNLQTSSKRQTTCRLRGSGVAGASPGVGPGDLISSTSRCTSASNSRARSSSCLRSCVYTACMASTSRWMSTWGDIVCADAFATAASATA